MSSEEEKAKIKLLIKNYFKNSSFNFDMVEEKQHEDLNVIHKIKSDFFSEVVYGNTILLNYFVFILLHFST